MHQGRAEIIAIYALGALIQGLVRLGAVVQVLLRTQDWQLLAASNGGVVLVSSVLHILQIGEVLSQTLHFVLVFLIRVRQFVIVDIRE